MPVILALRKEAEATEVPQAQGQPRLHIKFQAHQSNIVIPSLKEKKKTKIIIMIT